jgi:hypothetical protein
MKSQTAAYLDSTVDVYLKHKPEQKIIEQLQGIGIKHGLSSKQLPVRLVMPEEAEQYLFPPTINGPHLVIDLGAFSKDTTNQRLNAFLEELAQYGIVDQAPQDAAAGKPRQYVGGRNLLSPPGDGKEYELEGHFMVTTTPLNLLFERLSSPFQRLPSETLQGSILYGPPALTVKDDHNDKPITYYLETADGKRYIAELPDEHNSIRAHNGTLEANINDLGKEYWREVYYSDERWNELKGQHKPVLPVSQMEQENRAQQLIEQLNETRQSVADGFDRLTTLHQHAVNTKHPSANRMAILYNESGTKSTALHLQNEIMIGDVCYTAVIEQRIPADGNVPDTRRFMLFPTDSTNNEPINIDDHIQYPAEKLKVYQLISDQINQHQSTLTNEQRKNPSIDGGIAMGAGALLTAFGLTRQSLLGKIVGSLTGLAIAVAGALSTAKSGQDIRESQGVHIDKADYNLSTLARDFLIGLTNGRHGLNVTT